MGLFAEIDPSCSSLTFFEYCANVPTDSQCCGICNVVPVSGPGTVFAFAFGTFLNVLFALFLRTESPYNSMLAFLSVDGALISLLDRYIESKNRLDLFSYCFIPLSICSCIPVAVVVCLARLDDLHVISPAGAKDLRKRSREAAAHVPQGDLNHRPGDGLTLQQHRRGVEHAMGKNTREGLRRRKKELPQTHSHDVSDSHSKPGTINSGDITLHSAVFKDLPNPRMPGMVIWIMFGHLVAFTIVFLIVFLSVKNVHQENCIEEFNLTRWRIFMGSFSAAFIAIGFFFWFVLWRNVKKARSLKKTAYSGVMALAEMFGFYQWAQGRSLGVKREKILRCSISAVIYLLWVIPYLAVWFLALKRFLMLGPNPYPYEQVGASCSVLIPFLIVGRGYFDRKYQISDAKEFAAANAALKPDDSNPRRSRKTRRQERPNSRRSQNSFDLVADEAAGGGLRRSGSHRRHNTPQDEDPHFMAGGLSFGDTPPEDDGGFVGAHRSIRAASERGLAPSVRGHSPSDDEDRGIRSHRASIHEASAASNDGLAPSGRSRRSSRHSRSVVEEEEAEHPSSSPSEEEEESASDHASSHHSSVRRSSSTHGDTPSRHSSTRTGLSATSSLRRNARLAQLYADNNV